MLSQCQLRNKKKFYNVDPSSVAKQVDREDDSSAGQRFESPQRQASGDEDAKHFLRECRK